MRAKHADAKLSQFQLQVCIGTLLGDSSLSKPYNGKNYHLSCYHSEKQLNWLERKWQWLQPHTRPIQLCAYKDKRNDKIYRGARFHTISAPCFTELAELFYIDGKKIITELLTSKMTHPVTLACLICDDGSWDGAGISIASKQFTESENQILAETIAKVFNLSTSIMTSGKYPHIRIAAKSVEATFDLCQEYIPESLHYKFGGSDYTTFLVGKVMKVCPVCSESFESYKSANQTYCNRKCAGVGKPSGYETRTETDICPICGNEFLKYIKNQVTCPDCKRKPFLHETCLVCGKPVKRRGNKCCSARCATIAGHIVRGHNVTAIP